MLKQDFEKLFITMITSNYTEYMPYLQMLNNDGFTYCIKEIRHCLKNEIAGKTKSNNSTHLINNFYDYMLKDKILNQIDQLAYRNTLLKLKKYSEGDSESKKEKYAFFQSLDRRYCHQYFNKIYSNITDINFISNCDEEECCYYSNIFISELLAAGLNYLFLGYIANKYNNGEFESFEEFIKYLYSGKEDSYDIHLPIKYMNERDLKYFEKHNQKIEKIDEIYYCKIYQNNCIDLFYVIRQNIMRIESIFNILRLYTDSKIDFDYDKEVIINSKYFRSNNRENFDKFIKYKGIKPYSKYLQNTVDNFYKLKDDDISLYHKLLNTISYAKKDKDIIEQRSFVNNWIAMETLCSLSGRKEGFEAVYYLVPKALTAKIIATDITFILKKSFVGRNKMNLESFLDKLWKDDIDISCINNPYYKYCLNKYCNILKDFNNMKSLFDTVENQIRIDLLRIYMLRNEYVHESNLQAFTSMQFYKLKNLLQMMLDEFFKNLNVRIGKNNLEFGYSFESFNFMLEKYEMRNTAFNIINNKNVKVKRKDLNLHLELESIGIDEPTLELNILKNNIELFKKYVSKNDYKK